MTKSSEHLVVFDLGGVLVRIARGWPDVFERTGIAHDRGIIDNFEKIVAINNEFEHGRIDETQLFTRIADFGDHCEAMHIEAMVDAWLIEPYAGIAGLIDRVNGAGVATACLSNTNARHWRIMMETDARYSPLRNLRHRIASHLIEVMKPNDGAYAAVESQSGFGANQIIFFDDNADNIAAANKRGWRAHRIDPLNDPPKQMIGHLTRLGVL